jgi:hypothetical protein
VVCVKDNTACFKYCLFVSVLHKRVGNFHEIWDLTYSVSTMNNDDNDNNNNNNNNNNVKVFTVRLLENIYFILSSLLTVAWVRIVAKVIKAKDALVTVMSGAIHVIGI